jgi:hypothetical protein
MLPAIRNAAHKIPWAIHNVIFMGFMALGPSVGPAAKSGVAPLLSDAALPRVVSADFVVSLFRRGALAVSGLCSAYGAHPKFPLFRMHW